jgi:two-component system, sensor histidine kinase YesM
MRLIPRSLESNSIQITIAVSYSLLVIFTVLFLGTTALVLTRDALWDTTTYYTEQLVEQVRLGIGNYLIDMDGIATALLNDEDLLALTEDPTADRLRPEVLQTFETVSRMRPDISLLAVAGPRLGFLMSAGVGGGADAGTGTEGSDDGASLPQRIPATRGSEGGRDGPASPAASALSPSSPLNPAVDPFSQEWYAAAINAGGAAVYSGARVQNLLRDRYQWVISLSRARGETVLLVDLNFRVIEQLARSVRLGPRGYLFITDAEGGIVYHPQQQLIYSNLIREPIEELLAPGTTELTGEYNGDERLYIVNTVDRTGWRVVAVNSVDQLLSSQRRLRRYYLAWVALCFAIVMVLTLLISRRISLPLMRLRGSMQAVEQGKFDIDLRIHRRDEIGALSRDFAIMVATVRDLMARSEREQEEKRTTEIKALQNQIAPHFLYNTLDSIVWMAEGGRMEEVIEMTTNLARLLRLSIGRGEAMVSLRTELEHLRSYLTIQQMRYRDRLRFEIDVPDAVRDASLPRLTLQPVVENAIYHGIKNRDGGGTVRVSAGPVGDDVEIRVSDDGPGIDPLVLQRLRRQEVEPSGGVGLKNVHQRLILTFGEGYGISFDGSDSAGATVRIRIPGGLAP